MTSPHSHPHSGYPHQGPGYYQPSTPPTHVYGTHSPGPGHSPNPYNPYIYPHPHPHLPHHHQNAGPGPGRMNGRGGGSYGPRNNHHPPHIYHQNYHHGPPPPGPPPPQHQHPQPYPHPHPLLHAPHPQHPAKFPHPYTQPYSYPSPTSAAPYSPSWPTQQPQQQPQSPLTKQMSIPPPRVFSPAYYEPQPPPAPQNLPQISPPVIVTAPTAPTAPSVASQQEREPTTTVSSVVTVASPLRWQSEAVTVVQSENESSTSTTSEEEEVIEHIEFASGTQTQILQVPVPDVPVSPPAVPLESSVPSTPTSTSALTPAPTAVQNTTSLNPTPILTSSLPNSSAPQPPSSSSSKITTAYTMGTISHNRDPSLPHSPSTSTVTSPTTHTHSHSHSRKSSSSISSLTTSIAIWSRRPGNPNKAPGIIISPRAKPPDNIVSRALEARTPPLSPKSLVQISFSDVGAGEKEKKDSSPRVSDESGAVTGVPAVQIAPQHQQNHRPTATQVVVVDEESSGNVTEVGEELTVPASPVSSANTSVSAIPVVKDGLVVTATDTSGDVIVEASTTPVPSSTTTTITSDTTVAAPVPAKVTTAPRSWASLFASPASSSSNAASHIAGGTSSSTTATATTTTTNQPHRAALPTSSVIGFSIPAAPSTTPTPTIPVLPSQKNELLTLLTQGPGAAGAGVNTLQSSQGQGIEKKIRTRGLINQGNMCFANAVLQVLVYCLPFQRLFIELGRLLGGCGSLIGSNSNSNSSGSMSGTGTGSGTVGGSSAAAAAAVGSTNTTTTTTTNTIGNGGVTVIPNPYSSSSSSSHHQHHHHNHQYNFNNNNTINGKQVKSQTPFIDATIEFMKEFIEDDHNNNNNGVGNRRRREDGIRSSSGFSPSPSSRNGKGKEKEKEYVDHDVFGVDGSGGGSGGSGSGGDQGSENVDRDEWPESFLPSYVYEAMKEKKRFESMRGGQQEDAEEFLGFYLDTLEEELLFIQNSLTPPPPPPSSSSLQSSEVPPVEEKEEPEPPEEDGWLEVGKKNRTIITRTIKAVESPITRIFGGKFKSTLRAPGQKDSVLVEDWRSLRLDIQRDTIHTIQDALSHITHPQPIQMTHPSRPGTTIDACQRVLIDLLPPVLVLHVKRFCYDTNVGGVVKVMKQVRFEPELEIGSDMMAPTGKRPQPTKYRLFGAIYHHGHSASGGHYTLDVLHPNRYPGAKIREGWVRIDDELVSDVRLEDVFDAWDKEKDEMRNAYLLFYRRIRNV